MSKPFAVMLKPSGAICNLDCHYCYYLSKEKLYPGSRFRMTDELLAAYTKQFIASQPGPEVTFAWQGGEPLLMGLDFFERAVTWQQRYCPPNKFISNTLQTNGTLLDDAWGDFLARHKFLVGLSLDGPQALHDAYRVDKGGQPTFRRVMKGLRRLQKHQVAVNILATVHAANASQPLEVYRFLRDEAAAQFIQFIPIVERENETVYQPDGEPCRAAGDGVTARSVGPGQYGDFLIAVFDEWRRRDVGRVFVQIFDVALGIWLGRGSGLCIFAETCGRALALEHNGDLYACDHFVEPGYHLGNINQIPLAVLAASPAQRAFGQAKKDTLPRYCRECEVRFVCNGGCPKDRFSITPDGESGLNYLCAGYRAFFNHISRPMQLMAAEVMAGGTAATRR